MSNLTSSLIVRLIDQVTGPARGVAAAINRVKAQVDAAARSNAQALKEMQSRMLSAAGAGFALYKGLSSPIKIAQEFESALLDIAQKADLSDSAMAALGRQIRALAPIVNQTSQEVAKGLDVLAGFGLSPDQAMVLMSPIGKAATAYKAKIEDLAKAGFSALDNLKVPAEQFGKPLDVMAQAGKEGAFEIKDMASEFPALTAAAQGLGMSGITAVGRLTAALQIARKGAATGSEAATNTANLMQKIISPETTKKFKKAGIDIRAELKKVQATGGDVFEMIARLVEKATKGDMSKLGDFFQDSEVQKFLRPLIANLDEYRRIRDKALGASGVVDQDFARRMLTNEAQTAAFNIRLKELGMTIGNILLPAANELMAALSPLLRSFEEFSDAHPKLVGGVIKATAALIGLRVAIIAARFAFTFMQGALVGVVGSVLAAALGAKRLAIGLIAMLNPLKLATAALRVFKVALLGTGIGALLLAFGAAATFIYNNWKGLLTFFSSFFTSLKENLKGIDKERFASLITALQTIERLWKAITGEIDPSGKKWDQWGKDAGTGLAGWLMGLSRMIDQLSAKWDALASLPEKLRQIGADAIQGLWDGMKSTFAEMVEWLAGLPGQIAGALADLPGQIKRMFQGDSGAGTPSADGPGPQKDFTLGSEGGFSKDPYTETKPGRIGLMSARRSRRLGRTPLGQIAPDVDFSEIDLLRTKTEETGAKMEQTLNGSFHPAVNNSGLLETDSLLDRIIKKMRTATELGAQVQSSGLQAGGRVRQAMRAAHSDYSIG